RAARLIVERHGGRLPDDFDALLALPGIGRYTAGAICSIAFDQPQPILDGNVIRVLTRLFGIAGDPRERKTNASLWQLAPDLVLHASNTNAPTSSSLHTSRVTHHVPHPCSQLNQSLMELGALICMPRHPLCGVCPIVRHCVAYRQGRVDQLTSITQRVRV